MNTEEAVSRGIELFAAAETAIADILAEAPAIINAVKNDGHIGSIEAAMQIAAIASALSPALANVASLHRALTDRCVELGIDQPGMAVARSGSR